MMESMGRRLVDFLFSDGGVPFVVVSLAASLMIAAMVLGQWRRQRRILRLRRALPLVVGGWGTRGKSGTERKKSALLSALGIPHLSKSTGCEACFILGGGFVPSRNYVLFRPHHKPTIMEQVNILDMAAGSRAEALLWECMALQQEHVRILQDVWCRDDLSTITNAYPDHLDVQGPGVEDVARSISAFIGTGGRVLTTERGMLPLLRDEARRRGATLSPVDPLEGELICPDVLERYPYQVHPSNLTLVQALGAELGAEPDFVLKEVADQLIPDIGQFRTFPQVEIDTRKMRFTNGMSANDRVSAVANWERLDLGRSPEWTVILINNRADRVTRSADFASLVVNDHPAHAYVVVGTNISGMLGFVRSALRDRFRIPLPSDPGNAGRAARELLSRNGSYLRTLCRTPEELSRRAFLEVGVDMEAARAAASGEGDPLPRLKALAHGRVTPGLEDAARGFTTFRAESAALDRAIEQGTTKAIERWLKRHRKWYEAEFMKRIVRFSDPEIPGLELMSRIAALAPAGEQVHVLGIQNIKGTGFDFVLRWLRIDQIQTTLRKACDGSSEALSEFAELGVLESFEAEFAERVLSELAPPPDVRSKIEEVLAHPGPGAELDNRKSSGVLGYLSGLVESLFDPIVSLFRTARANRIIADLVHDRIHSRVAADQLRALEEGQDGGWLLRIFGR